MKLGRVMHPLVAAFLLIIVCRSGVCLLTMAYSGVLNLNPTTPHPRQAELEDAVARYLDTVYRAEFTMDDSLLSAVAAGDLLATHERRIQHYLDNPDSLIVEEAKLIETSVSSYSEQEAVVVVKYEYRRFVRDFVTGERDYGPSERWYWRKERMFLIREDDTWKVYDLEFIDWSG